MTNQYQLAITECDDQSRYGHGGADQRDIETAVLADFAGLGPVFVRFYVNHIVLLQVKIGGVVNILRGQIEGGRRADAVLLPDYFDVGAYAVDGQIAGQ